MVIFIIVYVLICSALVIDSIGIKNGNGRGLVAFFVVFWYLNASQTSYIRRINGV